MEARVDQFDRIVRCIARCAGSASHARRGTQRPPMLWIVAGAAMVLVLALVAWWGR